MTAFPRALRVLMAVVLATWVSVAGALETASENAVRAVLLFNLLKFSDLPSAVEQQATLDICVSSHDADLLAALGQLRGRTVRGKPLELHGVGEVAGCDAYFVDSRSRWQAVMERADASRTLTVGLYPGFINDGGLVEMDLQQGRARFDINQAAARLAGIRFHPQLLRLARRLIE